MTQTVLAADDRADARFHQQIAAHYRDYLAYLDAQLTLLDVQRARLSVAFERAESREDDERQARATLSAMSAPSRALFDAVFEQERQEALHQLEIGAQTTGQRAHHTDPDEAARVALATLRDDALGSSAQDGKGLLPRGKPDAIKWYAVDVAALRGAPTAAAYGSGAVDPRGRRRVIWQIGAALILLLLALLWLLVPRGGASSSTARAPRANGAPIAVWPVRSLVLTMADGQTTTLPISTTAALAWPNAAAPRAYWRAGAPWPIRLCLPAQQLGAVAGVRLVSGGATPDRRYTLDAQAGGTADLVLESCAGGAARAGRLSDTVPVASHAVGQSAALAPGRITVDAIEVIGPGEDPQLPPEQARVRVHVSTSWAADWPALAPTLLLPNGAALLPSELGADAHGAELRYLIPLPSEPIEVTWSVAAPADSAQLLWRAQLDPPAGRAAILRAALAVEAVRAGVGASPGTIVATLVVANRSPRALQLTSADITLSANGHTLATPESPSLRQPLEPGETRAFELSAPLAERETLTLVVGVERYAIAWPEGR